MILKLYEYAIASPQPEKWLWSCADAYDMPEDGSWSDFAGQEELLAELHTAAGDLLTEIQNCLLYTSSQNTASHWMHLFCDSILYWLQMMPMIFSIK